MVYLSVTTKSVFTENALFKRSGIICQSPLPSSLPDELPMDSRDSDSFYSVNTVSDSIYNMTDSSLIIAH